MAPDLALTHDGELMVVHVEGITARGAQFVDAYLWPEMVVVDSGRIILPEAARDSLIAIARERGLEVQG